MLLTLQHEWELGGSYLSVGLRKSLDSFCTTFLSPPGIVSLQPDAAAALVTIESCKFVMPSTLHSLAHQAVALSKHPMYVM